MSHEVPPLSPSEAASFRRDLTAAVREAHLPSLLAVMVQLSGDFTLLDGPFRPRRVRGPGDHDGGGLPEEDQERLREQAVDLLVAHRCGELAPAPDLSPQDVLTVLSACTGEEVPAEEAEMLAEELGVLSRQVPALAAAEVEDAPHALIIGAGFSGLCAAVRLAQAGFSYTIVEKNPEVGGTWFENTYPGCGVDTPVHLYSFSFTQSADWPTYFARQPEVHKYLIGVADEYGVRDHIRFGTEVEAATWDDESQHWTTRLRLPDGSTEEISTPVVISAVGLLNRPAYPSLPGLDDFDGPVVHTGDWDNSLDLTGKRVAVIGTGASAMQLVPAIVGTAAHISVFQRSPQWIIPNPNTTKSVTAATQFLMAEVPHYLGWYRLRQAWTFGDRLHPMLRIDPEWPHQDRSINAANERHRVFLTRYIERQLEGRPDLIAACVPTYPPYGKRPLLDHGWYDALKRPDVTLVADGVARVEGNTVVAAGGERVEADVIVLATGFQTLDMLGPMEIRGRSGASLRETWGPDDARALLGMTVPDFPNFFILFGPNTNAGHGGSHVMSVEMQVRYVLKLLVRMTREHHGSVEVRTETFEAFNEELDRALARSIWSHPGMNTYYRNAKGRIVTNVPWTNAEYWHRTLEPAPDDFRMTGPR
ncbi:flavin-containing monooxygenase [Streptomyces sp. GQFP]|uniref:flavin-containing monooxygenase n=1 Tax=Streptomyces sp. GQFP TaxID=2907545 RepID=UPI001F1FF2E9|nr:NAD(P)/FAD-dependent oxidoreductase [Streptomyces sp. GQFP]UIX31974.1 NAD(P)/FAD-dependent oxidoreductase [Streptomyces sp. GQFP]